MKKKFCRPAGIAFAFLLSGVYTTVQAQSRTVTGTVNDGNKPISGVTVSQEGSSQLTTTSSTGTFSLLISGQNPVLVFRHPEYGERKIVADRNTSFVVSLTEKVNTIQEVVLNAGYYDVKARESTGSIAKVTAKDIENQPVNNVLSAVQGRMAGVSITQNSGTPGGGFDVQIRGRNSLRNEGNVPLYIVDGVPIPNGNNYKSGTAGAILPLSEINPLNFLNPNDIESIEVLKDADATAIYGSRGANGVILISTKKGKSGKTQIQLNTSYGIADADRLPKMMNTEQYTALRKQAYANDGIVQYPTDAYDINGIWNPGRFTDWQKYFVGGRAEQTSTQAAISGGSALTQFSLSAGHDEQTTVFPDAYRYKRNSLGLTLSHRSEYHRFRLNFSSYYTGQNNFLPPTDFSRVYQTLAPNAPSLFTPSGTLNWENSTFGNPLGEASQIYKSVSDHSVNNITVAGEVAKGITLQMNAGYTYSNTDEKRIYPKTFYNPALNFGSERSALRIADIKQASWIIEPQVNFARKWSKHELNALVGASFQHQEESAEMLYGYNFPSDELISNIGSAATVTVERFGHNEYRYSSLYGRLNYQYNNRYILNVTGRRDASSRFGPNRRLANFGAVGAAWLFSEENFLKDNHVISFGKIRASYGTVGSDLIGNYQFYDTYSTTGNSYDGMPGLNPSRLFNPDFSWETTIKKEAAVETRFFKNRINATVAWFSNRSSNQLVGIPLPATTGFSSMQGNLNARVRNSGWEFSLESKNIRSKSVTWETSANLTIPKNELLSFPDLAGSTYANTYVIGHSTSVKKLYHYLGVDPVTGIYRFEDVNGDGRYDINDRTVLKDLVTHWYGGLLNSFTYKSFTLQVLVQAASQTQANMLASMGNLGSMNNLPVEFLDYWTPENPNAQYQKPTSGATPAVVVAGANFRLSDAGVSDSFFIRLKNVALHYKLSDDLLPGLKGSVYFQGQNLGTVTNYKGLDPEMSLAGFTPPLRVISFGINLQY